MALDEVSVNSSLQFINLEGPIRIVRTFIAIVELLAATCGFIPPILAPHAGVVPRKLGDPI